MPDKKKTEAKTKNKPKQTSEFNFNIRPGKGDESIKASLTALAEKEERSLNEFCMKIFKKYLENPIPLYN